MGVIMSASKDLKVSKPAQEFEADILFQRLCGKWYAFSMVNEDLFVGTIPDDQVKTMSRKIFKE